MTAPELAVILASRFDHITAEQMMPMADAVLEMCNEARAEERERCAGYIELLSNYDRDTTRHCAALIRSMKP